MERLLEIARKHADAVTVYHSSGTQDGVGFENGRLKSADSSMGSGTALTLVMDGKQGFAYTRNLIDREGLVRDALAALAGGVEAAGDLPQPVELPQLDTAAEQVGGNAQLAAECRRLTDYLSGRVKGQVNTGAGRGEGEVRLLTSSGVDARQRSTRYFAGAQVLFPGSYSSIGRFCAAKAFVPFPDDDLQFIVDTFNASMKGAKGVPGRSRALFLPNAVYALVWRLGRASNAKAAYEKVSPLAGRIGEKILSDSITFADEPLNDGEPGARAFDDEGTPCRNHKLFDRGVFRGFYNDRFYARKTGTEPTGNGYRGDITEPPVPSLGHMAILPGDKSLADLLKLMGRGVVVAGVMGAHSGNLMHGDYSIGLAPGLWVENGEIVGVVKDSMVAGNVYEDLKNVIAVGDKSYHAQMGRFPALLLDNVSFSARA